MNGFTYSIAVFCLIVIAAAANAQNTKEFQKIESAIQNNQCTGPGCPGHSSASRECS